jgi:hypothetical protein
MTVLSEMDDDEYARAKARMAKAVKSRKCMQCDLSTVRTVEGRDLPWCREHTPEKFQEQLPDPSLCGARNESKTRPTCGNAAGLKTAHPGVGKCYKHSKGGTVTSAKVQARNLLASAATETVQAAKEVVMGMALDVDPHDALRTIVKIAAGEVAYSTHKIQQLEADQATFMEETVKTRPLSEGKDGESSFMTVEERTVKNTAQVNIWIEVRWKAMNNLAKYSEIAIKCGIAEREVKLAESVGYQLAQQLQTVLEGLQLTPEQESKAPALVRTALTNLGKSAAIIDVERV